MVFQCDNCGRQSEKAQGWYTVKHESGRADICGQPCLVEWAYKQPDGGTDGTSGDSTGGGA